MILDNLSRAVKTQNWLAAGVEFVIVIAGVVIGFQINAWNEARQEQALQSRTLERLEADFNYLVEATDAAIAIHQRNLDGLRAVRTALATGGIEPEAREAFEAGLIWGYIYTPPAGRSGTFSEIQASGRMGLIDDETLRGTLLIYDDNVRQAGEAFLHIRMIQTEYLTGFTRLFETPPGRERGPQVEYDFAAMLEDPAFGDAVEQLTAMQELYLVWHQLHRTHAQNALAALEAAQ